MNKKTYALILVPAVIACGIIVDQVRPISPEELGIDLVNEVRCENAKKGINVFGEDGNKSNWPSEDVSVACTPIEGTLTEKEQREEQAKLRSLYNSRGNTSPDIWETSRDIEELVMMTRRIKHRSR